MTPLKPDRELLVLMFLPLLLWIGLSIVAAFLSAAARRNLLLYFTKGVISKPLILWIASMLVLDAAVILVGIAVGYNPSYLSCIMLLSIQWSYIPLAVDTYVKLKMKGNQFDEAKQRKYLRAASLGAGSLNTMLLIYSLGIALDKTALVLIFFVTASLWMLVDHLFMRIS